VGVLVALLGIDFSSSSAGDCGQVLGALFTAVAALAARAAVSRAERERRRSSWPDAPRRSDVDKPANQARLTVVNYGGPAREVRLRGVAGLRFRGLYGIQHLLAARWVPDLPPSWPARGDARGVGDLRRGA
jgi:hypothetical protein